MKKGVLGALVISALLLLPGFASAQTNINPFPNDNAGTQHWTLAGSPYVVSGQVYMRFGTLTIDPGVVIKFQSGASLLVHADVPVAAVGTAAAPITFTSIKDDSAGGDTNSDGVATAPAVGDWGFVDVGGGSMNNNLQLEYARFLYGGGVQRSAGVDMAALPQQIVTKFVHPALIVTYWWYNGNPGVGYTLQHIEVAHSPTGAVFVVNNNNALAVHQSSFSDASEYGVYNSVSLSIAFQPVAGDLDLSNNWWGNASGPYHPILNLIGTGAAVGGKSFVLTPWLTEDPFTPPPPPEPTCCSSVLFLPGIMGSRLYAGDEKLWESLNGDEDILGLYLNPQGGSVNPNVYTKDVIGTAPITHGDIYQPLLDDLAAIKSAGTIANYAAVPYDWRLALPDILAGGRETPIDHAIFYSHATSSPFIELTLRQLAAASKTGKVTIIAHSNGGLLAKALLNKLGGDASSLVDKLILVAVPQSGTPQAIGSLLHGFDTGLPFDWFSPILSPERARDFARNAPFAYHLLPHSDYYQGEGTTITTPLVTRADGSTITTIGELYQFINGSDGRVAPAYDDLKNPAIGNAELLAQAMAYVDAVDSSWVPPTGVEVDQIAGVGEDTLAGLTYSEGKVRCVRWVTLTSSTPWCAEYATGVIYTPEEIVDGDGTVVTPSALAMSDTNPNVKRWWLNLNLFNDSLARNLITLLRTQHGDIFEIDELRNFIFNNLITATESTLPTYVSDHRPSLPSGSRLRFVLHSSLTLSATDNAGHEVSASAETIPGSSYTRYGEVQVIWVPTGAAPTVHLDGEAEGLFTLEVDEFVGDASVASLGFSGIPTTANTVASIEFPDGSVEHAEDLIIDYNGDGTTDQAFAPQEGGVVTPAKVPLAISATSTTITLGNPIPTPAYTVSGFPGGESLATSDITGAAICTTTATATSTAGKYPITCTAGTLASNYYSFSTFVPGMLIITYKWSGFGQPIDDPVAQVGATPSVFKAGSTVPVKFVLKNSAGTPVAAKSLPQWLTQVREGLLVGNVDESVSTEPTTDGSLFKYDEGAKQYIYNWKTKGFTPGYWYRISTQLDDGTIRSVRVGLK